jgi:hypothetical protein
VRLPFDELIDPVVDPLVALHLAYRGSGPCSGNVGLRRLMMVKDAAAVLRLPGVVGDDYGQGKRSVQRARIDARGREAFS